MQLIFSALFTYYLHTSNCLSHTAEYLNKPDEALEIISRHTAVIFHGFAFNYARVVKIDGNRKQH